jgi:pimeloyl-ACP methyl ester carboxylesterase
MRDELLFADALARMLEQCKQNFQGACAETQGPVAFQQQPSPRIQAKRTKGNDALSRSAGQLGPLISHFGGSYDVLRDLHAFPSITQQFKGGIESENAPRASMYPGARDGHAGRAAACPLHAFSNFYRIELECTACGPHDLCDINGLSQERTSRMIEHVSKRATVNGVNLRYIIAGEGPVILSMHGWPQNHREFQPVIERLAGEYRFIAPDLRGFGDSDKPYSGYEPKTIAQDMLELLEIEGIEKFHILSHDLGGPPSVAVAYMAGDRALSLATIETPFFGLNYPGYVDPRVPYWHLGMHMNMDITTFLVEGREDRYLRHFFRDFAYNPDAMPEEDVANYVMHMRQPGNLRASLNHYGYIPQMAEQTAELTRAKLKVPMLAWGGVRSFGSHCIDSAKAISASAEGGVIEECGHWVFEERPDFICEHLARFWAQHGGRAVKAA